MIFAHHWMTGGAVGFQFDDTPIYDEEIDDLILVNVFILYLGIVELRLYWDKREQPYNEEDYPEE